MIEGNKKGLIDYSIDNPFNIVGIEEFLDELFDQGEYSKINKDNNKFMDDKKE